MKTKLIFLNCLAIFLFFSCEIEIEEQPIDVEVPYVPSNIQIPNQGLLGEYISITGNNLIRDSLRFSFDTFPADSYQTSEDTIKLKVPRTIERFNPVISIYNINTDSLITSAPFQLKAPVISHPEKTDVKFSEHIWIYGENFDTSSSFLKVTLNNIEVPIYHASHDSIQLNIPNNIGNQNINLKIHAQLQVVEFNNIMQLKQPKILMAPQTVRIGDVITLKGQNFNPDATLGSFTINDELAVHIQNTFNADSIRIKIPYGPYEDFVINKISYETTNMQSEYNFPIIITSEYILYTKNNPDYFSSKVHHYNGKSYAFGRNDNDYNNEGVPIFHLYELDYITREWTKINSIQFASYAFREIISDNGNMFLFTSKYSNIDNALFKINLNSFSIETISAIPNNELYRTSPVLFIYNNDLIFGKGRSGNGTFEPYYTDLYSYSLTNNNWTTLTADTEEFYSETSYNFQGNIYVSTYTVSTFPIHDLKLFNPSNNSFTSVTPPSTFQTENVFKYENKLLRVTIIPSLDEAYFYNYNSQNVLETIDLQRIDGATNFFSKDDKVFFYSSTTNNVYDPSNGFYLINSNKSNQL